MKSMEFSTQLCARTLPVMPPPDQTSAAEVMAKSISASIWILAAMGSDDADRMSQLREALAFLPEVKQQLAQAIITRLLARSDHALGSVGLGNRRGQEMRH